MIHPQPRSGAGYDYDTGISELASVPIERTSGIIFDLDDTLIPERGWMRSGYLTVAAALRERGVRLDSDALVSKMFAAYERDRAHVFDHLVADDELGLPQQERARIVVECVAAYRGHTPILTLAPEVKELLAWARSQARTGIATGGLAMSQRAKVAAAGLAELVDVILYPDALDPEYHKPHPRWFATAAELLECRPVDCIHIGDNPAKDFVTARELGMTTVRVRMPGGIHAHVEARCVDHEVNHPGQLRDVLELALATRAPGYPGNTALRGLT